MLIISHRDVADPTSRLARVLANDDVPVALVEDLTTSLGLDEKDLARFALPHNVLGAVCNAAEGVEGLGSLGLLATSAPILTPLKITYVIAPVYGRHVRAADPAAVARSGTVTGLALDPPQVVDACLDMLAADSAPSAPAVVLGVAEVGALLEGSGLV